MRPVDWTGANVTLDVAVAVFADADAACEYADNLGL
jgi:hypothetical protein